MNLDPTWLAGLAARQMFDADGNLLQSLPGVQGGRGIALYTESGRTKIGNDYTQGGYREPVVAVAPSNIASLSAAAVASDFDGITMTGGERVALPFQTDQSENGIYVVGTPSGGNAALTRATDFDLASEMTPGAMYYVQKGTLYGRDTLQFVTTGTIVVGTTNLEFQILRFQSGSVWRTLLDVDFTAAANQTLDSDTTYTVGGVDWTKKNSANDLTAMAVQNGVGLVCCPTAGLDHLYTGEAPVLAVTLGDLLDDPTLLQADTPIRAMVRGYTKTLGAASANCIGVALEYDAAGYACVCGTRYCNSGTTPYGGQAFVKHHGTVETVMGNYEVDASAECPAIWMPNGIGGMSVRYGRGTWSDGWPEIPWFAGWGPDNENWDRTAWPGVGIARDWQLSVGAATASQDAGYEWVIQNVRVEAQY